MPANAQPRRPSVRLRQAVLAATDLERVTATLQSALGLAEPFHDPAVGVFGLANSVFALGDCFIEVVSPERPDTAASRYMTRRGGDCGYMAIFDLEDLEGARARASGFGVRTAWEIDLPDISTTHLHPADTAGAIVSLDQSRPYGTWRWGGPEWAGRIGAGAPARLAGITLAVADPAEVAARWAHILGVSVSPADTGAADAGTADTGAADAGAGSMLELDGAGVRFVPTTSDARAVDRPRPPDGAADGATGALAARTSQAEGLVEIAVELPIGAGACPPAIEIGALRVSIREAPPAPAPETGVPVR